MSTPDVRLPSREECLTAIRAILALCEASQDKFISFNTELVRIVCFELRDRLAPLSPLQEEVEYALRAADLTGSSRMARTLAAEVRRLRGLMPAKELEGENPSTTLATLRNVRADYQKLWDEHQHLGVRHKELEAELADATHSSVEAYGKLGTLQGKFDALLAQLNHGHEAAGIAAGESVVASLRKTTREAQASVCTLFNQVEQNIGVARPASTVLRMPLTGNGAVARHKFLKHSKPGTDYCGLCAADKDALVHQPLTGSWGDDDGIALNATAHPAPECFCGADEVGDTDHHGQCPKASPKELQEPNADSLEDVEAFVDYDEAGRPVIKISEPEGGTSTVVNGMLEDDAAERDAAIEKQEIANEYRAEQEGVSLGEARDIAQERREHEQAMKDNRDDEVFF